jgi:hypothetical protein
MFSFTLTFAFRRLSRRPFPFLFRRALRFRFLL